MGFDCHSQQRIALSPLAEKVLEDDCIMFGCTGREGKPAIHTFINRVFCHSYDRSDASIEMRLAERREQLQGADKKVTSQEVKKYIEALLKSERKKLEKKIDGLLAPDCSESYPVSLNNITRKILTASREDAYYKSRASKYIRAVVEEYASMDSLARSEIFFRKSIETLLENAGKGAVTEIKLTNRPEPHLLIPVCIQPDIYKTHLYLAGISCRESAVGKHVSYRLDQIDPGSIQYIRQGILPPSAKDALADAINRHGIQYLSGETSRIRVRLSQSGIQKYRRMTFQRPPCSSIEGENKDIYVFDIPEYQAIVYFFKFGADAQVLEPEALRRRFRKMYQKALDAYNDAAHGTEKELTPPGGA